MKSDDIELAISIVHSVDEDLIDLRSNLVLLIMQHVIQVKKDYKLFI
jgi:hypothetical protein